MSERATLAETGNGQAPTTPGWFVLNAKDARWMRSEKFGMVCAFQGDYQFPEIGVNLRVLRPGEPNCFFHVESVQEDFLVLSGECLLLVDEEQQRLKPFDYVHLPAGTPHVFVGASKAPCLVLMIGARGDDKTLLYPDSEFARKFGAGVDQETSSPEEAYASCPEWQPMPGPGSSPPEPSSAG